MYHILLTFIILSVSAIAASDLRFWTVDDGTIFKAKYESFSRGTLTLTNESGKQARFSIKDMGVADRYYLHEQHNIPIEQLEGGNILNAEEEVSVRARDIAEIDEIELEGEGYEVTLEGYLTPHYLVLYEKRLDVEGFVEALELAHFSHSYRHPNQNEIMPKKRAVFLFIEDDDLYEALGKSQIEALYEEGMAERDIQQVKADWAILRGHRPWTLPQKFQEKFNAAKRVDIEFPKSKKSDRDRQVVGFYNQRWWSLWPHRRHIHSRVPGAGSKHIQNDQENSIAFCLTSALMMNNDIRTFEESSRTIGGGLENSSALSTGRYGESRGWTSELARKVKSGDVKADFRVFYDAPVNIPPTTQKEYDNFGMLVVGAGRFMEHDLKHMFGVSKLAEYIYENRKFPSQTELPAIFGYASMDAMNAAFEEFLLDGNRKMKP
ncbi:hypothetical protein ACFPK9_12580 [Rubritalea spongiae]|uniref:SLA1 homology domain-containing protein n=1 Tax=Rubritalea spongiae TaxID=430797 RepID=A0ABW5E2H7_9BACT